MVRLSSVIVNGLLLHQCLSGLMHGYNYFTTTKDAIPIKTETYEASLFLSTFHQFFGFFLVMYNATILISVLFGHNRQVLIFSLCIAQFLMYSTFLYAKVRHSGEIGPPFSVAYLITCVLSSVFALLIIIRRFFVKQSDDHKRREEAEKEKSSSSGRYSPGMKNQDQQRNPPRRRKRSPK
ncbi:hypothetical protein BLNAU_7979 [Blattamonas nauphoetae]|uniref:Uncharacterized protein n=1 Tax=Blattamonas nauphoetae TaxID=2049346 RepID=A0ABQ9Y0A2_9EUKA|nr:hypothetical protein BLNAU_7979 [Blattamonas nauphoetae]